MKRTQNNRRMDRDFKYFGIIPMSIGLGVLTLYSAVMIGKGFHEEPLRKKSQQEWVLNHSFPSEYGLTVSASDYVKNIGKELSDYNMVGVKGVFGYSFSSKKWTTNEFWHNLPKNIEVIVDIEYSNHPPYRTGTALIPKE